MPSTITCEQFARNLIEELGLSAENTWYISARNNTAIFSLVGDTEPDFWEKTWDEIRKLNFADAIQVWYTCTAEIKDDRSKDLQNFNDKLAAAHWLAFWAVYNTLESLIPAPELSELETNTP